MTREPAPTGRPVVPRRSVLADSVYEVLKAMVMDHIVAPGARMNIDTLARELDVSQTPIREALARLESDGLVVKEPLRGYSAAPLLNSESLEQLFELRFLIEPWAAARAAERATDEDLEQLTAELDGVTEVPWEGKFEDYRILTSHDQRFHALVHEMSGNSLLRVTFERTQCHHHLFRLYYGSGIGTRAVAEHRQIVAMISAGKPDEADAAMRAHLSASRDRLRPVVEKLPHQTPQES